MKRFVVAGLTAAMVACGPSSLEPSSFAPSTPTPPVEGGQPALPSSARQTEWQPLGDGQSRHPREEVDEPSIALLPDGTPLIAWSERVTHGPSLKPDWAIRVSRWSGSEWLDLGTDVRSPTARAALRPSLLVDRVTGTPIVAWSNHDEGTVQVRAWDGSTWVPLGQELGETQAFSRVHATSLAQDQEGHVWVAWSWSCECSTSESPQRLEVARWNGTAWEKRPNPPAVSADFLALAVDASGRPILAASIPKGDGSGPSPYASVIRAYRWDDTTGWTDLGEVAQLRRPAYTARISLALDTTQAPTIAWFDLPSWSDTRGPVAVKQWTGQGWRSLGAVNENVSAVTLSALPNGTLLLGHSEGVLTWDGGTWNATKASRSPVAWRLQSGSALFASPDGTLYGASAVNGIQVRMLK